MDSADKAVEEETDESKAQLVSPSTRRTPTDEEPTTVKQYCVIIHSYQTQLLRAERQLRAVSKSALADRFLENEVTKYVKERLWKHCKFITCRETMAECMNEVSAQFAIEDGKREHWKSTYEHAVRDALNNRRSNTAQDLKKELNGKCNWVDWVGRAKHHHNRLIISLLFQINADLRGEFPGYYESPEIFEDVCSCDAMANFQPFWLFFDRLVANVAGKKIWTNRDKVGHQITKGNKISIVDEAFTILAIQNYWPEWFGTNGVTKGANWTDSRQGNSQYMGWSEDAYKRFDLLCQRIKNQRTTNQSKQLEIRFQQMATEECLTMRGGARARLKRQEPTFKVFNELDSFEVV